MDSENKSTGYSFNLLHEEVASKDLFPDETHENVAKTILKLIDTSDRGITVGIEGSWGSGKSTVVELLKQKIIEKKDQETLFFLFDAWAHEGDPLRRIFLESLIKEIDPDGNDAELSKFLKEISSRTKTVEVKTEKKASRLGKKLFLSTLVLPIGAAILSAINYSNFVWPWSSGETSVNGAFLLGLLLSAAPFFTLLYWRFFGDKDEKNNVKWDFMESDSIENYIQDITEEGERTSIEFEQYFEKILDYILGNDSSKKFQKAIIVIDNLDRVGAAHAASIWSTLQTFFQHRSRLSETSPDWMRRLWFLVPYDREGLSRIWDVMQIEGESKKDANLSKSFLSKSFQVVAEVPTPVMSAWYDYCVNCINKSLEQWPERDKKNVINTFQLYGSKLEISPTPRKIHNFVNQVGLLGMRWGGIMSAESIALYAIFRQDYTEHELRQHLLGSGLPGAYDTTADSEDIKMELSGMLFGVKKDKGIELLIGPVIRSAMTNGEGKTLEKLINQHGEAFWIAWNAIKKEITITNSHVEEYRIAATQAMHDGLFEHRDRIVREISSLEKAWRATDDKWELARRDYSSVLPLMADISQNKSGFIEWSHDVIKKKLREFVSGLSDEAVSENELIQFNGFELFLSKNDSPLKRLHYTAIGVKEWSYWIKSLNEAEVKINSVLPKRGVITEISNSLLTNQNVTSKVHLEILLTTLDIYPKSNEWNDVADRIISWANSPGRELEDSKAYELMLGLLTLCSSNVASKIKTCLASNTFWQKGNAEDITTITILPILAACALGEDIQRNEYINSHVKDYWISKDIEDEKNTFIIDTLTKFNNLETIWELLKDDKNQLAVTLIVENSSNAELYSKPNAILGLNSYKWIKDEHKNIVKNICEYGDIEEVLIEAKNTPLKYDYGLHLLKKYGTNEAKKLVIDIVESINEELWGEVFRSDSYIINAALDDDVSLNHRYTDAFVTFITSSFEKDIVTEWIWTNFSALLKKTLDTDIQLEKLAKSYFSLDEDSLNEKAFLSLSTNFNKFINNQDSIKVMNRLCFWIDNNSWKRIEWLSDSGFKFKGEPIESLSSRLNSCIKEIPEGVEITLIDKLIKLFKVKIIHDDPIDEKEEGDVE